MNGWITALFSISVHTHDAAGQLRGSKPLLLQEKALPLVSLHYSYSQNTVTAPPSQTQRPPV